MRQLQLVVVALVVITFGVGCGVVKIVDPESAPEVTAQNMDFEEGTGPRGLPAGWGGTGPGEFEISVDGEVRRSGNASIRIRSVAATPPSGHGNIVQNIETIPENVEKVRLSGFLKVENVSGPAPDDPNAGAGFFMTVRDATDNVLAGDNMGDRRLYETIDWKEYSIELPLPDGSSYIAFGFILSSAGTAWGDDFSVRFLTE